MAIVTGLREYKGIVHLQIDGMEFTAIRRADFDRYPLEEGDAIDEEAYIDRIAAIQMKDAGECVLRLLEASEKPRAMLISTLSRRGFVAPAAEAAVMRAEERRYVDDKRFAARTVELNAARPVGKYALMRKLRQKGISAEDAEEALVLMDDNQQQGACAAMFEKIRSRYEDMPAREARAKCSQALARRGFSWDAIRAVVDSAFTEEDW